MFLRVFAGLVCASGQSLRAFGQAGGSAAALPEPGIRPPRHQPATRRAAQRRHVAATMLSGPFAAGEAAVYKVTPVGERA